MIFRDGSDKGTANFVQISGKAWWRPWQWIDKRSGKKALTLHGKSKLNETEKGETGEQPSQEHAHHISLTSGGLFTNNWFWHAEQSIPHSTDILWRLRENVPRLRPEQLAVAPRQRTVSLFLFSPRNFDQQQLGYRSRPTIRFSVSPIEDKTERPPFWHNWGYGIRIAGGAEHRHRTWRSARKMHMHGRVATSRVMVSSRSIVSFWPSGSTSPGNYGWLFVY
jgi:hypothetical protein